MGNGLSHGFTRNVGRKNRGSRIHKRLNYKYSLGFSSTSNATGTHPRGHPGLGRPLDVTSEGRPCRVTPRVVFNHTLKPYTLSRDVQIPLRWKDWRLATDQQS